MNKLISNNFSLLVCFIYLFAGPLLAADSKKIDIKNYSDTNSDALIHKDKLLSPRVVIEWINENIPARGEFEKKKDYDERVSEIRKAVFGGVFAFPLRSDNGIYKRYDPDNECFTGSDISVSEFIDIESKYDELGGYRAENAFGKVLNVKRFSMVSYGIHLPKGSLGEGGVIKSNSGLAGYSLSFKFRDLCTPIERAKNINRNNISAVIVGYISDFEIKSTVGCLDPTIDRPTSGCVVSKYITVRPINVVIYDNKARTVYAKNRFELGEVLDFNLQSSEADFIQRKHSWMQASLKDSQCVESSSQNKTKALGDKDVIEIICDGILKSLVCNFSGKIYEYQGIPYVDGLGGKFKACKIE